MALPVLIAPGDVYQLLGERIRGARKQQGWSQQELARRAAVGVATIQRLESSGQGQVSTLVQVFSALGRLREFEQLLRVPQPRTLEELRKR